jgi:uncharacterized protein (TIGR02145 family)
MGMGRNIFLMMTIVGISFHAGAQQSMEKRSRLIIPEQNIIRTVEDIDGNVYKTIDIDYQTWMMENLRTTRYRDGSPIPQVVDNASWVNTTSGAYCWYNNDTTNKYIYGALYNRYAIEQNLCPEGWDIPNVGELQQVIFLAGGYEVGGRKMKEAGSSHWTTPNIATNSTGFTALPGGVRSNTDGSFRDLGILGSWWTEITDAPNLTFVYSLRNSNTNIEKNATYNKEHGLSVRCIKKYSVPVVELERGLIAYYPFNGNASDESGNKHHGTAYGATQTNDRFGNPNKAYVFTGAENSLEFQDFQLPTPSSTIVGWVKITDENADTILATTTPQKLKILLRVVDHKYQVELSLGSNKIILTNEYAIVPLFRDKPRFDFLAIVFSGRYLIFTINKALIATELINDDLAGYQYPFTIKRNPVYVFNGILDDVRIYNRGLTYDELWALNDDRVVFPPEIINDSVIFVGLDIAVLQSEIFYDGGDNILESGYCWSTTSHPDTSANKSEARTLTGLLPSTTYYVRAYARNRAYVSYGRELSFTTLPEVKYGSLTDIDGNDYKTVKIGTQTWMAENLKTTKYADGTPIGDGTISNKEYGKYYFVYHNDSSSIGAYGLYYTWMAATNSVYGKSYPDGVQGACPNGWHIPNYAEQKALVVYLDPEVAGGKLKETGTAHWNDPNTGATNATGFSAVGTGLRQNNENAGRFKSEGDYTAFWGSESTYFETFEGKFYNSIVLTISNKSEDAPLGKHLSTWACPIRCLKDSNISYVTIPEIITLPVNDISGTSSTVGGKLINDGGAIKFNSKGVCWSKNPNPDTSDYKTIDDIDFNYKVRKTFSNTLTSLEPNTKYYARAYAANSAGVGYGNELSFITTPDSLRGTITDIEGNIYKTIKVGNQVWMGENLRTTHLNDGDPIQIITNYDYWSLGWETSSPDLNARGLAMGWYQNDSVNLTYGALYNWKEVDSKKLCPTGWHVPALNEWEQLERYLGGAEVAGGKMKVTGIDFWVNPNEGATNESGFSALPGGFRDGINGDHYMGSVTKIWTSTNRYFVTLTNIDSSMSMERVNNKYGCSVRCIQDSSESAITGVIVPGDIDSNTVIEKADATLALQYSAGLDPLPSSDPLPWESWRVDAADVDKQNGVTAYDASLILQYEAGLIKTFPGEDSKKNLASPQADIDVSLENRNVIIRSVGNLYGFNLNISGSTESFGKPEVLDTRYISAVNFAPGDYSVAMASAYPPEGMDELMKIPVNAMPTQQVTINLLINNQVKQYILGSATGIREVGGKTVEIYPNPANSVVYFLNLSEKATISIYDLRGKAIMKTKVQDGRVDISALAEGIYFMQIMDGADISIWKLIKQ